MTPTLFHWLVGGLALVSAIGVVASRNAVMSAMNLMCTLLCTGMLYLGAGASFVGAVQILVYAGAISVLFVFVVMLLDTREVRVRVPGRQITFLLGLIVVAMLGVGVVAGMKRALVAAEGLPVLQSLAEGPQPTDAKVISLRLLTEHMAPFQLAGFLILAAIIGAILLGRPEKARAGE